MSASDPDRQPLVPHPPLREYYESEDERRPFVGQLFDTTAHHYGWITRVMALGSGEWYRWHALQRAELGPGMTVLDVCIGTGQVARPALRLVGPTGRVIGLDASIGMLANARGCTPVPLMQGVVEQLPINDCSIDFVTMGYALRHVRDLVTVFSEYRRVLRPGGRVVILEFTRPRSRLGSLVARIYLKHLVPTLALIRGRDARTLMRYFWDTIENCVPPETILGAISAAGLTQAHWRSLYGLCSEYTAVRGNDRQQ